VAESHKRSESSISLTGWGVGSDIQGATEKENRADSLLFLR
jgi:hypothetical protein